MVSTLVHGLLAMAPPAGGGGGSQSQMMSFLPIILILVIFYFLILAPQQKQRKEIDKLRSELKKGDRVVTTSGLFGTLVSVEEKTVVLRVDDKTKLTFLKSAVAALDTGNVSQDVVEQG